MQKVKRTFVLFELLLAFFLLSCLLFPMIKNHYMIMRSDQEQVSKIQLERIKESVFADIRTKLWENKEFSFSELRNGISGYLREQAKVHLSPSHIKHYDIKYEIHPIESCKRKSIQEHYLLVEVKLTFLPKNKNKGHDFTSMFLLREHA